MMVAMIACAVLGIIALGINGQATITAPMVVSSGRSTPWQLRATTSSRFCSSLFACSCAVRRFHSLVSSGTSSKQISNETHDALPVGYGAVVLESFVEACLPS